MINTKMTEQRTELQKFLEDKYMPLLYSELLESTDGNIVNECFGDTNFFIYIYSNSLNFFEEWCETPNSTIQAETILILLQEVQTWYEKTFSEIYTKYKVKDIVNYWAYIVGHEKWKKYADKEEKVVETSLPNEILNTNETEDTCPICLRDYDRNTLLQDGPQNSDFENPCPHWCCVECWDTIYHQYNDTDTCPICRADITDWLKSHYPLYDDEDSD